MRLHLQQITSPFCGARSARGFAGGGLGLLEEEVLLLVVDLELEGEEVVVLPVLADMIFVVLLGEDFLFLSFSVMLAALIF